MSNAEKRRKQSYYNNIVEEYWNWLKSKPNKFHFIKWLIWHNSEPCSFDRFMQALEYYDGDLK